MKSEIVIILLRSALFGAAFIGFPPSLIELEAAPASSEGWASSIKFNHKLFDQEELAAGAPRQGSTSKSNSALANLWVYLLSTTESCTSLRNSV